VANSWWPDNSSGADTGLIDGREKEDHTHSGSDAGAEEPQSGAVSARFIPARQMKLASRQIHVAGLSGVGLFVAHALAGIPSSPPITLLLRSEEARQMWDGHGEAIAISRHGHAEKRTGFNVEVMSEADKTGNQPIENLILANKCHIAVAELREIARRLRPSSTILFLHHGMGDLEEINQDVFPDVDTRPSYMIGVNSHELFRKGFSEAQYVRAGLIALTALPRVPFQERNPLITDLTPSARYLLRTLTRTPALAATAFEPTEHLQLQLEHLVANSVIGSLTAILDCKNEELVPSFFVTRLMRLLIAEMSLVIRSLPELQEMPNLGLRFSPGRLEAQVLWAIGRMPVAESPVLMDLKAGRKTEIDYLNGYFIRRGEELGINCVVNYTIMQMARARISLLGKRNMGMWPVEKESEIVQGNQGYQHRRQAQSSIS
jgi:2-dehydropantoate 2-reductase